MFILLSGVYTGYNLLSVALTLPKDGKVVGCDISTDYFDIGKPIIEEVEHMSMIRKNLEYNGLLSWPIGKNIGATWNEIDDS